jgi:hypothetical protein
MTAVKATVRKGRLELDEPLDLPDGTELLVPVPDGAGAWDDMSDEPMPPEEIARRLALMDAAEALEMTDEELDQWDRERREEKDREIRAFPEYSKKLAGMWE